MYTLNYCNKINILPDKDVNLIIVKRLSIALLMICQYGSQLFSTITLHMDKQCDFCNPSSTERIRILCANSLRQTQILSWQKSEASLGLHNEITTREMQTLKMF